MTIDEKRGPNLLDASGAIARFIETIEKARDLELREEVDGWIIHRPSLTEVDDFFGVLIAESKPGCTAPLQLPQEVPLCIGVLEGMIHVDGLTVPRDVPAGSFWTIRPSETRSVRPVTHPSKIAVFYFRGAGDDEPGLASRAAA